MLVRKKEADIPMADLSPFLLDANNFTDDNSTAYINQVNNFRE